MIDIKSLDKEKISFVLQKLREKYAPGESTEFLSSLSVESLQTLLRLVMTKDKEGRDVLYTGMMDQMNQAVTQINMLSHKISIFRANLKEAKQSAIEEKELAEIESLLDEI